jgi:hypothetical protein
MARETTEGISVRKISTKIDQPAFEEAANNLAIPGLLEGTMGREVVTRQAIGGPPVTTTAEGRRSGVSRGAETRPKGTSTTKPLAIVLWNTSVA